MTKINGNNLKVTSLAIILCAYLFTAGCFISSADREKAHAESTQKTEEKIASDPKLKEFNELCNTFPVMETYRIIGKSSGSKKKFISHFYTSDSLKEVDWENVKTSYTEYFEQRGWKLIAQNNAGGKWLEFKKDGKYVLINNAPDYSMNWGRDYGITCSDSSYSMVE
jgi:hypothetical protein